MPFWEIIFVSNFCSRPIQVTTVNLAAGTYTSPALLRAFDKLLAEDGLQAIPWTDDEQEYLDQHLLSPESPSSKLPYKFNKFFKTTRIPRDTTQTP